MCEEGFATREHVPPISFFPEDRRVNLITVPSCIKHNNSNSKDVEYVRNYISMSGSASIVGRSHFLTKALKSYLLSPGLFKSTFKFEKTLALDSQKYMGMKIERAKFENIIFSIGNGLFYHDFKKKFEGSWTIIYDQEFIGISEDKVTEVTLWFMGFF